MKGSSKRGRGESVKSFLDCVMESIEETGHWTPIDRQTYLLAQSPDYVMLLRRAWCYQELAREDPGLSDDARARKMGSKAEAAGSSSLYKQARTLYTLIVLLGLHKFRFWCPTKQMLNQLFHNARSIEEYVRDTCPEEANRWADNQTPVGRYPSLTWYVGPQLE